MTKLLKLVANKRNVSETTVVFVDKDFTVISAIKEAFQPQFAIQLCLFNDMKDFTAAAGEVSMSAEERYSFYRSFEEMVNALTPDALDEADGNAQSYLEQNWAHIPPMWPSRLCDRHFNVKTMQQLRVAK